MNKYIKFDLRDSVALMKIAIMNALHDIDSGAERVIELGEYTSPKLFKECLASANWFPTLKDYFYITPSGKTCYIENFHKLSVCNKLVDVTISITMSSTQSVLAPSEEISQEIVEKLVEDQINTPIEVMKAAGYSKNWTVDDYCVIRNDEI